MQSHERLFLYRECLISTVKRNFTYDIVDGFVPTGFAYDCSVGPGKSCARDLNANRDL